MLGRPVSTRCWPIEYSLHVSRQSADSMSGQSLATEAHFGPPSECIKINDFLHEVAALEQSSHKVFAQSAESLGDVAQKAWAALSDERRASIEEECGCVTFFCTSHALRPELLRASVAIAIVFFPFIFLRNFSGISSLLMRTRTGFRMYGRLSTT